MIETLYIIFQEAQLNEVLSASNLDPSALTMVTRKLEVRIQYDIVLSQIISTVYFICMVI